MTNFEKVTASPEALADITFDESHGWQAGCETRSCRLSCKECFLEWLKQEAEENEE